MSDQRPFGPWLARLQNFDRISFNGMLRRYLASRLTTSDGLDMLYNFTIPMLSGSSCMSLAEYAAFVHDLPSTVAKDDVNFWLRSKTDLVKSLIPNPSLKTLCGITVSYTHLNTKMDFTANSHQDAYKFRLDQMMYAATFPEKIFAALQPILSFSDNDLSLSSQSSLYDFLASRKLSSFLLDAVTTSEAHKTEFIDTLRSLDSLAIDHVRILVDNLVNRNSTG